MAVRCALGGVLVVTLAAGGVGCRLVADRVFTPPAVTFKGVALRTLGLRGGSLDVLLTLSNPNPYALSAKQASYRLLVRDSVEVGHGATTEAFSVPSRDSVTIRLPLDVTWTGLREAGRDVLGGGAVAYRVVGQILATSPLGSRTFPFDERGRFTAR